MTDTGAEVRPRRARPPRARRLAALGCAVLALSGAVLALDGCGGDQLPWCSQLDSVANLDGLAAAIRAGDAEGADTGLDRFNAVASSSPVEIRADMEAVADALAEAVGVAMTDDGADPDDLELRREAVNEQLARVTTNVAAVSAWAEQECGIRLD